MVKVWRKERKSQSGNITSAGIEAINEAEGAIPSGWDEMPLGEAMNQPAEKFVQTMQRWCERGNAESYGKHKRIDRSEGKIPFTIIRDAVDKIKSPYFDVRDIIRETGAIDKTDGALQRKVLAAMVCLGYLKARHVKFKGEKGKDKVKYVFVKLKEKCPCPTLISGKCGFDWEAGALTDYFPKEYEEEEDLV